MVTTQALRALGAPCLHFNFTRLATRPVPHSPAHSSPLLVFHPCHCHSSRDALSNTPRPVPALHVDDTVNSRSICCGFPTTSLVNFGSRSPSSQTLVFAFAMSLAHILKHKHRKVCDPAVIAARRTATNRAMVTGYGHRHERGQCSSQMGPTNERMYHRVLVLRSLAHKLI